MHCAGTESLPIDVENDLESGAETLIGPGLACCPLECLLALSLRFSPRFLDRSISMLRTVKMPNIVQTVYRAKERNI